LVQVGRRDLAEQELRKLAARARPQLTTALAALAERLRLPAAQMRIAQRLHLLDGRRHDGAMYPLPPWSPEPAYTVDRAVLFALTRAESGFDPDARSAAGAIGLMQVLPDTAAAMAERYQIDYQGAEDLFDPVVNLTLGQSYVQRLLELPLVNHDLIKLAMAYNAGLKRLQEWLPRMKDLESDPILYVESVPIAETRAYIRKVMSNVWAYRARMGQAIPSLQLLAEGRAAAYVGLDGSGVTLAGTN
jgi:soluble lytic murein transglycosylase-like protein